MEAIEEGGAGGLALKRRRPDRDDTSPSAIVAHAQTGDTAAVRLLRSLAVPAASLALPSIGDAPLSIAFNGSVCLIWNPADCARVRSLGRLCASPIGLCPAKVATRGKAAAVPVVLNDEELFVATQVATNWKVQIVDTRTGRPADPRTILAANAASDPSGMPNVRRRVFADLWRRGYRCTNGLKFGCDWLSYTADASQVHAAFMVIVRRERRAGSGFVGISSKAGGGSGSGEHDEGRGDGEGDIAPLDLVAKSRVATAALKICVMAYASADHDDGGHRDDDAVRYAAFKRMGPGSAVFQSASALLARTAKADRAGAPDSAAASIDGLATGAVSAGASAGAGTSTSAGGAVDAGGEDEEALEGLSFLPIDMALGGGEA